VLSAARQAFYPKEALLLEVVSVPFHNSVIYLSWNPRRSQREWLREKIDTKWRTDAMFFSRY
jgi:hypothetical protein